MPEIRCEVREVVPPGRIAEVRGVDGRLHQINVSSTMIRRRGTEDYLAIGIVRMDPSNRRALIEFRAEAGQDTSRVWVGLDELWHDMESQNVVTGNANGSDHEGDFPDILAADRTGPSAQVLVELARQYPAPQEWWDEDFEGL
jgi:hypothetical protein